ncbi:MAG TPA: hypothetical protein VK616_11545, partial [Flavitalea sp.]|nr:hypothetical protein [Flavitalea sp.]
NVGLKIRYSQSKGSCGFHGVPVEVGHAHLGPVGILLIGLSLLAGDTKDFMARFDEFRNQVGADMACAADDDNSHWEIFG